MGEENTEWTFKEDDNINVFTYLSLFGSGKWSYRNDVFAKRAHLILTTSICTLVSQASFCLYWYSQCRWVISIFTRSFGLPFGSFNFMLMIYLSVYRVYFSSDCYPNPVGHRSKPEGNLWRWRQIGTKCHSCEDYESCNFCILPVLNHSRYVRKLFQRSGSCRLGLFSPSIIAPWIMAPGGW